MTSVILHSFHTSETRFYSSTFQTGILVFWGISLLFIFFCENHIKGVTRLSAFLVLYIMPVFLQSFIDNSKNSICKATLKSSLKTNGTV